MPYVWQIKRAHAAGDTAVQFNDRSMPARLAAIERAVASANVPREKVRSTAAHSLHAQCAGRNARERATRRLRRCGVGGGCGWRTCALQPRVPYEKGTALLPPL